MKRDNSIWIILVGQLGLLVYAFWMLAHRSGYIWDEAIYGLNALEMLEHRNPFLYTVEGASNFYNTKPPLVLWLQATSAMLFGANMLALRIPTFGALLLLIIITYRFVSKQFSPFVALLSTGILLSTPALLSQHVFLTADLDGVLVTILTAFLFYIYTMSQNKDQLDRHIYVGAIIFFLGFLTKSTAILLILPSAIFIAYQKGVLRLLWQKWSFYWSVGFSTLGVMGYYLLKEYVQPGTWRRVWFSEVARYYDNVIPWHHHGPFYYFQRIFQELNPFYAWLTALLLPIYFLQKDVRYKKEVITLFGALLIYLIVVSIPNAKLDWYVAPIFPIWAVLLSVMLNDFYQLFRDKLASRWVWLPQFLLIGLLLSATVLTALHIKEQVAFYQPEEKEVSFIQEHFQHLPTNIHVLSQFPRDSGNTNGHNHHNDLILLYDKFLSKKGKRIQLHYDMQRLEENDTILFFSSVDLNQLGQKFKLKTLDSSGGVCLALLHAE